MMIAQNHLLRAAAIVTGFWYAVFLLVAAVTGATRWTWLWWVPLQTLVITGGGLALGFALTLYMGRARRHAVGATLRDGASLYNVKVSLGSAPSIPVYPQRDCMDGVLDAQPWWPRICESAPLHAAALRGALRVMATVPRLPASPYPGGHAGRTLIVHSLAVAAQTIATAKTWVYEGQKDKRGRVRVKPENGPHRFTAEDIPLLVLTGFVHDIGKILCYQPLPDQRPESPDGDVLRVMEVRRNHDTEGAKLLRQIPEIMALPLADRTALITAVGYYHHPFGLPNAGWMNDRIRSLTECLAAADIATGTAEGHALLDDATLPDDDDDDAPDDASASGAEHDSGVLAATGGDVEFERELNEIHAAVIRRDAAPIASAASDDGTPFELRTFMDAIRARGAISGPNPGERIAWRSGENVYVMESIMRRRILNTYTGTGGIAMADAMSDADGNAAPFTRALLEQLDAKGALVRDFNGTRYAPARALFNAVDAKGTKLPAMFVVPIQAIPGAGSAPEGRAVRLVGPLWGAHQGRPIAQTASPGTDLAPASDTPTTQDTDAGTTADYTNADMPFDSPPPPPIQAGVVCAAALLAAQDGSISMERLTRDGVEYLLVPAQSPSGDIVRDLHQALLSDAGDRKVIPPLQVNRADTLFFALPVPTPEAE